MSTPLQFTDTSLTDGQMAWWGGALTTPMLLCAIRNLADSRLAAIEVLSPAVIDACIARGENPLQRVSLARRRCSDVPLRATVNLLTSHGRRGADVLGTELIVSWFRALAASGIQQVVLLDALQEQHRMFGAVRAANAAGLVSIAAVAYVGDAEIDDATFAHQASSLAGAGAQRVMLRDESGLLTPDRARTLLPAMREALGSVPLDLHTRCHTALGPLVAIEAVQLGVNGIDTALPCLANGASLPALPLLLRSLKRIGIDASAMVQDALSLANTTLGVIADQEGFAGAMPWAFDLAPFAHQLPGEVASECVAALHQRGRWADVHVFAAECAAVRVDMGSPTMMAPFARAIAEQAMRHFDGESRYQTLRPVLRRLLQGVYGKPPRQMHASLQRRVGCLEVEPPPRTTDSSHTEPQLLLAQVSGVDVKNLPSYVLVDKLYYETVTPQVALARALAKRAPRYALVAAAGPGVVIRLQLGA